MALSGARATWENYTLDGVTNTDLDFNTYIVLPSVEALQEFKVQSGIYPAEFGREAGQVNVSTKPGTNEYHGTAFEFLRNNDLDARPYDFSAATRSATNPSPKSNPYRQNQFGFTLGGPVQIPKLFNGKNRLFFMSNFRRIPLPADSDKFRHNPDAGDAKRGFLRNHHRATGSSLAHGYLSQHRVHAFPEQPDSIAPESTRTPLLLMKFFPLPNQPTTSGAPIRNYQYLADTPVDKNQVTERIDFTESSNSQWFGRYSWTDESTLTPGITSNDGQTLYTRASQWVLSNVRILSPTKVNEARFGYSSLVQQYYPAVGRRRERRFRDRRAGNGHRQEFLGHSQHPADQQSDQLRQPHQQPFSNQRQGTTRAWITSRGSIGKHSLRMGGEYRYNEFPQLGNEFPRGQFFFNGHSPTPLPPTAQTGGYSGADFLMGDIQNSIIAVALASADFRNSEWAAYIDDTWKVRRT